MTTRVSITHRIEDRFERPVLLPTQWLRLRPAPQTKAEVSAYSLVVHAEPHFLNWLRDPYENHVARLDLPEPVSSLGFELEMIAALEPANPFDFLIEPFAANHPFDYPEQLHKELEPYLFVPSELGPRTRAFLKELERKPGATVEYLDKLNQRVHSACKLTVTETPGVSDLEQVLTRGTATAWDLAWLLTLSFRHTGHAARMVGGYRIWLAEDPSTPDFVGLHAWTETFIPGAGWVGLDPAMGLFTAETYIPLAAAPDPRRVLPGVGLRVEGAKHTESLRVRRLTPRPDSWPYNETQWADIQALGYLVEQDLAAQALPVKLGASLSFVSAVHANEPEWNTSALGPTKWHAAEGLLDRLQQRVAKGGVPQLGQGQWFAGDQLPRWRLSCYFRADGRPAWLNPARLGWGKDTDYGLSQARDLAAFVARALGIASVHVLPAHEDALYALARSTQVTVQPSAEELRDPASRRALADRLSRADRPPTGYVLPLRWDAQTERWTSGAWPFRREQLYLLPGGSPLGYRLPLDSLMRDPETALEAQLERDPFAPLSAWTDFHEPMRARLQSARTEDAAFAPGLRTPRTALSVEARAGKLYVFVPPVSDAEHYLQLVAALETAAEALELAVILEGYEPPEDPRLRRFSLEPDAAVLRLHLPVAQSWSEQLALLHTAYTDAAWAGLRAERVMADGRRMPSGGGGPISVGGSSPADSPFLTQPDTLRGLVAYFQRHPSLSYFFVGHNIGGSSSTPRPDQGRDEALYELAIGLSRLPRGAPFPWQADRALRHLLTDPAGDMKRAEIRVDQLFAPDRASRRLGKVTVHAFETAPEPRLQALQVLLLQALIARFARIPDSGKLVRWGAALSDRFLLPRMLWEDLREVIEDLNQAGFPFQLEWFEPLLTLRFQALGTLALGEITLQLQTALEPWPVLAEEVTGGGIARFIDTANERLQVSLKGLTPGRHVLVCNDQRVPLQQVGDFGEYVAGVRYKVVNPMATMHPTVWPVHSLVFDVLDAWTGRVLGGCTFHPGRPQVWGAYGYPVLPPQAALEQETGGERPKPPVPLPAPSWASRPWTQPAHFVARGSGVERRQEPYPLRDDRPYLLDLVF